MNHSTESKSDKSSLKSKAYDYIRGKLLNQEWISGHGISHREIASEMGIGFMPSREAINQLVAEGLLECHPKRGTFVARVVREDLADLFDVREALEYHVIWKIITGKMKVDYQGLRSSCDSLKHITGDIARETDGAKLDELGNVFNNTDLGFHKMLYLQSGNRLAIGIVQELRDKIRIFGHRGSLEVEYLNTIIEDHGAVIDLLKARDLERAGETMRKHIRRAKEIVLESFDRNRLLSAMTE